MHFPVSLRRFAVAFACLGGVFAPAAPAAPADTNRPNIILILADDLGVSDLGSSFYETPRLDRLAKEGARFTAAYAACPVCSPSRAALMSGQYPPRTGITDYIGKNRPGRLLPAPNADHLALETVTLAEALRTAGYTTAHMGKWHLGGAGYSPEQQGFEVNVGGGGWGHPPSYFSPYHMANLPDGPEGEYLTDRLATEAEKFIAAHTSGPFFLNLWTYAVHTPLQGKSNLVAKYERKLATLPTPGPGDFRKEGRNQDRRVQNHAVYAAMMESLDQSVGRVLDAVQQHGLADRTLVIFTSDNGGLSTAEGSPTANTPYRAGKGWLFEGGVRVPLLVRWPGVTKAGTTCATPVITMDLFPTVLTAAGVTKQPATDGVNWRPLLEGKALPERSLFWHYPHYGNQGGDPGGAIRTGDWKLIEWFGSDRRELYNLRNDVEEQKNLAAAEPEKVRALHAQLETWRKDVKAILPTPNPDWKEGKKKE